MKSMTKSVVAASGKRAAMAAALGIAALAAAPMATAAGEIAHAVPAAWHGEGRWGRHDGRWGWWWIGPAGVWTWYAYNPYYPSYPYYGYPYPNPYPPMESAPSFSNMPAPPQYWYYCDASKAYYPNVPSCAGGWRPVPAAPEAPSAPPAGQQ